MTTQPLQIQRSYVEIENGSSVKVSETLHVDRYEVEEFLMGLVNGPNTKSANGIWMDLRDIAERSEREKIYDE